MVDPEIVFPALTLTLEGVRLSDGPAGQPEIAVLLGDPSARFPADLDYITRSFSLAQIRFPAANLARCSPSLTLQELRLR
ncbi:hypothetical protein GCM10010435_50580 [Winogradskya consettensis]|uniref:Uncharacterized protein n=1 Tax=Winogradskya consettensis TaxID=113560 RepID=A0A919VQS7_9ACTN|nr:hypothetical protein Aco04nite_28850 [Actinoplanes consettensis]